jgi:hypothetical protein
LGLWERRIQMSAGIKAMEHIAQRRVDPSIPPLIVE